MKNIRHFLPVLALLTLMGCNGSQREIERTARGYLEAMGNYRIDEAAPYSTQFTRENTLPIAKRLTERTNPDYIRSNTPADITIKGSKQLDDTTARVYYHKHTPITEQDDSLTLMLENGEWLVDVRIRALPAHLLDTTSTSSRPQPTIKGDSVLFNGRYIAIKDLKKARKLTPEEVNERKRKQQ